MILKVIEKDKPIDICRRKCHPTYRPTRSRRVSSLPRSFGSSSSRSGDFWNTPRDCSSYLWLRQDIQERQYPNDAYTFVARMLIATLKQGILIKRPLQLIDRIYAQDTPIIPEKVCWSWGFEGDGHLEDSQRCTSLRRIGIYKSKSIWVDSRNLTE